MSGRDRVFEALRRWEDKGLVGPELASRLRVEVESHESGEGRRWAQYAIAATGAVILIIAAGVFLRWAWPLMGAGSRSALLAGAGLATLGLGIVTESRTRLQPAAYLLQAAGLALLLMSFGYSRRAWSDASPGAVVFGVAILSIPLASAFITIGRNPISPAIHTAFGYAFLFAFLERSSGLDTDSILWILDAVALVSIVLLAMRLRAEQHQDPDDWTLNAFVTSLYAAGVLLFSTAAGPLDFDDHSVWALNVWLAAVTALTLWGIHGAPAGLRRAWFGRQLALCVFLAIPLTFATALGALDLGETATSVVVAIVGFAGLRYGLRFDSRDTLAAGCIALLAAAWYFGSEKGGAIGAFLALAFSAALFFWLSVRLGRTSKPAAGEP